eukprot:15434665-Alexandrium_andersonii.AAC.1
MPAAAWLQPRASGCPRSVRSWKPPSLLASGFRALQLRSRLLDVKSANVLTSFARILRASGARRAPRCHFRNCRNSDTRLRDASHISRNPKCTLQDASDHLQTPRFNRSDPKLQPECRNTNLGITRSEPQATQSSHKSRTP